MRASTWLDYMAGCTPDQAQALAGGTCEGDGHPLAFHPELDLWGGVFISASDEAMRLGYSSGAGVCPPWPGEWQPPDDRARGWGRSAFVYTHVDGTGV